MEALCQLSYSPVRDEHVTKRAPSFTRPWRLQGVAGGTAPTMNVEHQHQQHPEATTTHDAGVIIRFVLIAVVVIALVLVALDNTDDVRVGYVFGDANAPIWIVLVLAAIGGIIIGALLRFRRRHSD